ncbi:MAG TPA: regulatory iron-sulfur-containing complex subunit RicT [Gemmatimonadales bacterium]|nr:regulatory iron-sulfur-containing complex subunit RicT [Gemmatimonadales bacterium]
MSTALDGQDIHDGHVYEVRFKGRRNEYFSWSAPAPLSLNQAVIVDTERGQDLGRISAVGEIAEKKCTRCGNCAGGPTDPGSSRRRIVRPATTEDVATAEGLRQDEDGVRSAAREKVREHSLPMKVTDAEWQWDRKKLTLYFTAEQRVDFRALVRDLASRFHTRIELRQIGARDEARRLTGVGRCGREYCSASWLPELKPVNLSVAKAQHLSLNPAQISGPCGRLLCCLHYEHDFYVESRKRFPKEGKILRTAAGEEKVLSVDIFRDRVTLRSDAGTTRTIALSQLNAEVQAGGGPVAVAPPPPPPPQPQPQPEQAPPRPAPQRRPGPPATPVVNQAPAKPQQGPEQPPPQGGEGRRRRRRRNRKRRGGGPPSPPAGGPPVA